MQEIFLERERLTWNVGAGEAATTAMGTTAEKGELELALPPGRVEFRAPGGSSEDARALEWPVAEGRATELRLPARR